MFSYDSIKHSWIFIEKHHWGRQSKAVCDEASDNSILIHYVYRLAIMVYHFIVHKITTASAENAPFTEKLPINAVMSKSYSAVSSVKLIVRYPISKHITR